MTIKIGNVEKAFAALLIVSLIVTFAHIDNLFGTLVVLTAYYFGVWVIIRILRPILAKSMWGLRNRLIVAYLFIALVPVVLIATLVGIGIYLIGGQISIYLVSSEMDRRTASIRSMAEFIAHNPGAKFDWNQVVAPYLQAKYPGIEVIVDGTQHWVFPSNAAISTVPPAWPESSGLLLKDGALYNWARVVRGQDAVTILFPVTYEYLGDSAGGLGRVAFISRVANRNLLQGSDESREGTKNRVPPTTGWFDWELNWQAPVSVALWDSPGKTIDDRIFLVITSRPSALLRVLMTQKVDVLSDIIPFLLITAAILFLVAELISLIIGISLTRTITSAVHNLYQGTVRVMRGDFSHRIPPHGRDQLGELADSFNQMTANLERLVQVEKDRQRLQSELEIAREVQNQLYPKSVPQLERLRITAACQPARLVSGDYYDYQKLDADGAVIAIGDVAGKGISAALLMATVQSSFRTELRSRVELAMEAGNGHGPRMCLSTAEVVSQLNQQIYSFTSAEKFTTFFMGMWDDPSRTLTYTNAGHLPPILVRNGSVERLSVDGMVVGAFPFAQYESSRVTMQAGDLVVFFTDGITEPENEYGEQFGEDRLANLVVKNAHLSDTDLLDLVMGAAKQWSGEEELQDDMTLLMIRSV